MSKTGHFYIGLTLDRLPQVLVLLVLIRPFLLGFTTGYNPPQSSVQFLGSRIMSLLFLDHLLYCRNIRNEFQKG